MPSPIRQKEQIAIDSIEYYLGIRFDGTTNKEANQFIRLHIEEAREQRYLDEHAQLN